jgi:hypothetical protein
MNDEPEPELLIQKHAMYLQIPDELLMDYGAIPDTRPRVPVSRRMRLRWRLDRDRERLARWAYRRIAGCDLPEEDQ